MWWGGDVKPETTAALLYMDGTEDLEKSKKPKLLASVTIDLGSRDSIKCTTRDDV